MIRVQGGLARISSRAAPVFLRVAKMIHANDLRKQTTVEYITEQEIECWLKYRARGGYSCMTEASFNGRRLSLQTEKALADNGYVVTRNSDGWKVSW